MTKGLRLFTMAACGALGATASASWGTVDRVDAAATAASLVPELGL